MGNPAPRTGEIWASGLISFGWVALMIARSRARRTRSEPVAVAAQRRRLATCGASLWRHFRPVWLTLTSRDGGDFHWKTVVKYLVARQITVSANCLEYASKKKTSSGAQLSLSEKLELLEALLIFLRGKPETGLRVAESSIPGAGLGLFTTRAYSKVGSLLCVYRGTKVGLAEAMRRKAKGEHGDYVMGGFGLNWRIDAGPHPEVYARYINDNADTSRINARFIKLKRHLVALVVSTRPIASGEEIFAAYGESYWRSRNKE